MGLQPEAIISMSDTTGRHGSRFQVALSGSTTRANTQWHANCSRIPAVAASGASATTSAQAAASSSTPHEVRPAAVGTTSNTGRPPRSAQSAASMYGGASCAPADADPVPSTSDPSEPVSAGSEPDPDVAEAARAGDAGARARATPRRAATPSDTIDPDPTLLRYMNIS